MSSGLYDIGDEIKIDYKNADEYRHIIGDCMADLLISLGPDDGTAGIYEVVSVSDGTVTLARPLHNSRK